MKEIFFIHGVYHGKWCWENDFLKKFRDNGYKVHCPDLRKYIKEDEKESLLLTYTEHLHRLVMQCADKPMIVVHSAYSIVLLEYLKRYSDTIGKVVFITPIAIKKPLPRILFSGIKQIFQTKETVFFTNRLSEEKEKEYISKLCTEESGFTMETSKKHWGRNDNTNVPILFIGSENDKCVSASWVRENAEIFSSKCVIYEEMCHDMMLDPERDRLADDILSFMNGG